MPHPSGTNLFYNPHEYNARKDDLAKYNPSLEGVVDRCLVFKAIQL